MEVLSLGGGIQSTALFLMNLHHEIEPGVDFAIFADTGWERQGTYENITRLNSIGLDRGFGPIWKVKAGNIRADMLAAGDGHYDHMPLFTQSSRLTGQLRLDGSDEVVKGTGQLRRQCTGHYKIDAINRAVRDEHGMARRVQWIGFSVDELQRMRPSRVKYITLRFPLIEKRMSRADCVVWLLEHGYAIPVKSSCIGCPYHTDAEWVNLTAEEWKDACKFDDAIRDRHLHLTSKSFRLYLHSSLIPLSEVKLHPKVEENLEKDGDCAGGCWL